MKHWMRTTLGCVCAAALLAGCAGQSTSGSQSGSASASTSSGSQQADFDVLTMKDNNSLNALLGSHTNVLTTHEITDGDGATATSLKELFWVEGGGLQATMSIDNTELDGGVTDVRCYSDSNGASAIYSVSGDNKSLVVSPAMEYIANVQDSWLPIDTEAQETVEKVEQTDAGTQVTTRTVYEGSDDTYIITVYTLDADGLMQGYEATTHQTEDDAVLYVDKATMELDTSFTTDVDPYAEISGGSDYCELSVVIAPETDDMEVQWYPVAHDTVVRFSSTQDYTLYSDEALTQELSAEDAIDVSGAANTVYVVYNQAK